MSARRIRVPAFLNAAGLYSRWAFAVFAAIAAWAGYEWWIAGASDEGVSLWLMIFPVAAGTGLLTIAREGKLDLLLGSNVSRTHIYAAAFTRAVIVPAVLAALLAVSSVPRLPMAGGAIVRVLAVAILTGGFCFSAGLLNPGYAAGVAWIAMRIAFLMIRPGFRLYHELTAVKTGGPMPALWKLAVAAIAFPEAVLLRTEMPMALVAAAAVLGASAAFLGLLFFRRAELPGHRGV
jgi:hypothetical protein